MFLVMAQGSAEPIGRFEELEDAEAFVAGYEHRCPGKTVDLFFRMGTKRTERFMVEVAGGIAPRQVIEFADPRVEFCEHHNASAIDGSVAKIIRDPGLHDEPTLSFARHISA